MLHELSRSASAPPRPGFRSNDAVGAAGGGPRIPAPRRPGAQVAAAPAGAPAARLPLSERDLVLVRQLARGASVTEVAAALSVSRNTARTRIRRVRSKLAVPDRGRLDRAARELGLL